MLFGASYYYEYLPYDRLADDVALMRAAGVNYERVGDSIWALCEPREGVFELDWLQRVLDALHEARIAVVLATPTYAVPPWLARDHPEVMAVTAEGTPLRYGGRQNIDFSHPEFRRLAEPVLRALLDRYARHPSVIGVQMDNEIGLHALHNDHVFDAFVADVRQRYGDLDTLNDTWGLNYWSHRLHDWSELWRPGTPESGNSNPSYDLAWRRFQASLATDFLAWQAGIARDYLRPDQFVTHDLVGGHGRRHVDRRQVHGVLDLAAENFPHQAQDGLRHPPVPMPPSNYDVTGTYGAVQLFLRCDLARSPKHRNFLVTEMNSISVGGSAHNFPDWDGQWRLTAYTCISRGAIGIAYWHWHTLHFGHEIYSGGILGHDFLPNRCSVELSQVGAELGEHGELLTGLEAEAEVGIVYSDESRWAFEFQPPLPKPGSFDEDPASYERIFDAFYRGFFAAGAQLEAVRIGDDLSRFPVVVVPALYIADDASLASLVAYAEAGGHLVVSFRTGHADEHCRVRTDLAPGPLREAVGASYNLFSNLTEPVPVRSADAALAIPAGASATAWADELVLDGAQPLAWYEHRHFGRFPAAVTKETGSGRVTYVGTLPDADLACALAHWVLEQAGVDVLRAGLPESLRVTRATARTGERLWFLSNWSHDIQHVKSPVAARRLFDPDADLDGEITLRPWDMCVLVEEEVAT